MVVCRKEDAYLMNACSHLNDHQTALCTKIERDFLRQLAGGCSTPISALAEVQENEIYFKGSILSVDGQRKAAIEKRVAIKDAIESGIAAANELLMNGGKEIADSFK
jgi:hydroxymethylbilane synthase